MAHRLQNYFFGGYIDPKPAICHGFMKKNNHYGMMKNDLFEVNHTIYSGSVLTGGLCWV